MNGVTPPPVPKPASRVVVKIIIGYFIFSLLAVAFFAGFLVGNVRNSSLSGAQLFSELIQGRPEAFKQEGLDASLFWEVWSTIADEYVEQPVNVRQAFYGALKGMVASLGDPYSIFLDPEETNDFNVEISGQFEGIGAEIGAKDSQIVVIAPLPESPAERAGLKAGDAILQIDETNTIGLSVDQAVALIRGEKGSTVRLMIERSGVTEAFALEITRETIVTSAVRWRNIESNLWYIAIFDFSQESATDFSRAVNEILLKQPQGLILDLRNNPGGYLDTAVEVGGAFIENNTVVVEEFSDGTKNENKTQGQARLKGIPTVVLVNGGTASAAEILAGALQDYGLATIIGEQTFGKGTVQDYTEFDDGSSLKITVAQWLTPKGRSIERVGIVPDIEVERTEEQFEADQDPQLDKAKEYLIKPSS